MPQALPSTAIPAAADLEAGRPPASASARPLGGRVEVVDDEVGSAHESQRRGGGGHDEPKNDEPDIRGGGHVHVRVDVRQVASAPSLTRVKLRDTASGISDGSKGAVAVSLVSSARMRYVSLSAGNNTNHVG